MSNRSKMVYNWGIQSISKDEISDILSSFRDFKIDIIQSNKNFQINEKNFKEFTKTKEFKAFSKFTPEEIITGSISLYLFGLINRKPHDVDLITVNPENYKPFYSRNTYAGELLDNYHGFVTFRFRENFWNIRKTEIDFDFFEYLQNDIITYCDIKIENPLNIIQNKIKLIEKAGSHQSKHYRDLKEIFDIK